MKEQLEKQALASLDKECSHNKELGYQKREDSDNQYTSNLVVRPEDDGKVARTIGFGCVGLEKELEEYLDMVHIVS